VNVAQIIQLEDMCIKN